MNKADYLFLVAKSVLDSGDTEGAEVLIKNYTESGETKRAALRQLEIYADQIA